MRPFRSTLPAENPTEAAGLAGRIRAGDATAEAELIARYRPGVAMLLRKHVKDPALADDLSQEVFRIALQSLREGRLEDGEKLAAYLWGIARNLARSEARRRHRWPTLTIERLVDPSPRADDRMLQDERARMVREAVRALAPRDRAVLSAFYLAETQKDVICQRLGLSSSQFDVIKCRALKRMMAILKGREADDD